MGEFDLLAVQQRVWSSDLTTPEKVTAQVLLAHWSRNGQVFPSLPRLAHWTSLGRSTVIRAIASLEAKGAIRVLKTPGKSTHYDVTPLAHLQVSERDRCQSGTGVTVTPDPCQSGTGPVPQRDPNRSSNKSKKESTNVEFALEHPSSEQEDPVGEVLKHWTETLWSRHHDRAPKLNKKRRDPVSARLKDGYSVADLQRVIDAVARSGFHMGQNDKGQVYIEPETIFRNAGKVDSWLAAKTTVIKADRLPPSQMGMSERYEAGTLDDADDGTRIPTARQRIAAHEQAAAVSRGA